MNDIHSSINPNHKRSQYPIRYLNMLPHEKMRTFQLISHQFNKYSFNWNKKKNVVNEKDNCHFISKTKYTCSPKWAYIIPLKYINNAIKSHKSQTFLPSLSFITSSRELPLVKLNRFWQAEPNLISKKNSLLAFCLPLALNPSWQVPH